MAGDYSRFSFDPRKDYTGVLMQQGRVQLDADWNELVALLDRRWRAQTVDTMGRYAVPRQAGNASAFEIGFTDGEMTIGRGRIYVDGLLVENHGARPLEYDPVFGAMRGTRPVTYRQQPYLPEPVDPPAQGRYLVYLDTWQREVTALEDPGLIEKAIGVDTATRLQTVWQVKWLSDIGAATCSANWHHIEKWERTVGPSAGRLSTAAVGSSCCECPSAVAPSGGYQGLGNRLYRVEVHNGGTLRSAETPTFKWSRNNGSVAAAITAINGPVITVAYSRPEAILGFRRDDWVEVTDDWRELRCEPGEMRKVLDVDEATRTVTLDAGLPSDFGPSCMDRHTRLRRWDWAPAASARSSAKAAAPNTNGVMPVELDTPLLLEDGIQITFTLDPSGGALRVGDYWVFAARTSDASVEVLEEAPPRGVIHHYCRLAMVDYRPTRVESCRILWPPEESCGSCHATNRAAPETQQEAPRTMQDGTGRREQRRDAQQRGQPSA